ncbi:HGxxPAAW family protein [Microbacterium sp. A93]|uniref:HGxxPAAW family protein n=1 Tax=unclassified Microbacterium TaxID=2609290 RepID=UPI003F41C0E9
MTNPIADPGHGHSPAAWTAVVVMLIGVAAGTVAYCLDQPLFVWISVGIVVVGMLLGVILAKAGWGVNGHKYSPKGH